MSTTRQGHPFSYQIGNLDAWEGHVPWGGEIMSAITSIRKKSTPVLCIALVCVHGSVAEEGAKSGPSGSVLRYDGVDDYVHFESAKHLDLRESMSVNVWMDIHPDQRASPIVYRGDRQPGHDPYQLNVHPPEVRFIINGGDGTQRDSRIARSALDMGWHMWTGVRDVEAGEIRLYKDGVLVSQTEDAKAIKYETSTMYNEFGSVDGGSWGGSWGFYKGDVDQIGLWNRALNANEVETLFKDGAKHDDKGLVGLWLFEEAGELVIDSSPFGHHGTMGRTPKPDKHDPRRVALPEIGAKPVQRTPKRNNLVRDYPGEVVFSGTYQHHSRGKAIPESSTLTIKESSKGERIAIAQLSFMEQTDIAIGNADGILTRYTSESTRGSNGYAIDMAVTGITSSIIIQRAQRRMKRIGKEQKELVKRWGEKVTGKYKLDDYGFPVKPIPSSSRSSVDDDDDDD